MNTEFDWRGQVILQKLAEGCTITEASAAAGLSRRGVLKRRHRLPEFAQAVQQSFEAGAAERRYRMWLRHHNRGKRGPWSKPGVVPAFRWGRR